MNVSFLKTWASLLVMCLVLSPMCSCAGPEEKKLKFYNKGKALYEADDYALARVELKNAIQIDPKYADAHYLLGMVELKDKNYKETMGRLNKAVELNPGLWEAHLQLGRLFLAAKLYDKALEKARIILASEKDHEKAIILEAAIRIAEKKTDEAVKVLDRLETLKCTDPEFFLLKAAYPPKGVSAEEILRKGIAVNPKAVGLHSAMARMFAATGRYEDLLAELKILADIEPREVSHRFNLGDVYLKLNKTREAETAIQSILTGKEDKEGVYVQIARYYLARNRVDAANAILEKGKETIRKSYDIHLALAEIRIAQNRKDEAERILKSSLEFDRKKSSPGIVRTMNSLASLYLSMGRVDQAKTTVADVLKEDPKSVDALQLKGMIALSEGKGAEAVSCFRSVIAQKPEQDMAYAYLSRAHVMNKENLLAMDAVKNGLKNLPDSVTLKKERVNLYLMNKDYASAEPELKDLISKTPADPEIRASLGDLYENWGKKAKALAVFAEMKKTFPAHHLGYIKMAQSHVVNGKLDLAVKELESARKTLPDSFEILSNLVKIYTGKKDYDKASAICKRQIERKKEAVYYHNLLGGVMEASGNIDKALASYKQALSLNPQWPIPANSIARVLINTGKTAEAEKALLDALEKNPDNSEAAVALGMMYENRKDFPKARAFYESMLKKRPNSLSMANNLAFLIGETSSSADDLNKAVALSEKVLKEKPGDSAASDTLGWLYYKQGNYDRALATVSGAYEKNPDNPVLNYHMGMIKYKKGLKPDAKKHLEKAVKSNVAYRGIHEAKAVLDTLKG